MKNRIRIESHGDVARDARVFLSHTNDKGIVAETDISSCFQRAEVTLGIDEPSRATLYAILTPASITAGLEDVFVKRIGPPRHFRRTRRYWHSSRRAVKRWIARSLSDEVRREIARTARKW